MIAASIPNAPVDGSPAGRIWRSKYMPAAPIVWDIVADSLRIVTEGLFRVQPPL